MFHMASLLPLHACFAAGASFASLSHFDPDVSIRMLDELRPAVVYSCFPPVTMGIMHHPGFAALRPLGARAVMNVAPPDTQRLIAEAFAPARLVGAYGCTEGTGTLSYHAMEDDDWQRINTCGVPMTGTEVLIFDPVTSQEVPVGERGEIVIRGRNRFAGYYRDEPHTREAIDDRGFFHTGDIGSKDAAGHVYYHGRLKDMLKVGGENVAALEVEDLIATLPGGQARGRRRGPGSTAGRSARRVRRGRSRGGADRAGGDRVLPRRRSRASRCRATSASSPSGRCRPPRSRSTGCASSSRPSWRGAPTIGAAEVARRPRARRRNLPSPVSSARHPAPPPQVAEVRHRLGEPQDELDLRQLAEHAPRSSDRRSRHGERSAERVVSRRAMMPSTCSCTMPGRSSSGRP